MKKIFLFLLAYSCFVANSQPGTGDIALIPQPVSLVKQTGSFVLPDQLTVYVGKNPEVRRLGNRLAEKITVVTGRKVEVSENENSSSTGINLVLSTDKSISKEGYSLDVKTTHVVLEAPEPAGLFYGLQTLFQLLPKEIESTKKVQKEKWEIPAVQINDHPRFGWRGLMLDVSRHFFTKEQVKQLIDELFK